MGVKSTPLSESSSLFRSLDRHTQEPRGTSAVIGKLFAVRFLQPFLFRKWREKQGNDADSDNGPNTVGRT